MIVYCIGALITLVYLVLDSGNEEWSVDWFCATLLASILWPLFWGWVAFLAVFG